MVQRSLDFWLKFLFSSQVYITGKHFEKQDRISPRINVFTAFYWEILFLLQVGTQFFKFDQFRPHIQASYFRLAMSATENAVTNCEWTVFSLVVGTE
jgi:hypothetical protein